MSSTPSASDFVAAVPSLAYLDRSPIDTDTPQQPSRCDITMDAIKSYIINHKLVPGDSLPTETELCQAVKASRSSVREAVRKLEALHIVKVVHGRGTFVGDLSLEPLVETLAFRAMVKATSKQDFSELRNVVQVRRSLDKGVAESIVAALKGTEQPELMEITDRMVERADHGDSFLDEDIAFHSRLLAYANNTVLTQLSDSLWMVHMAVLPSLGLQVSAQLKDSAEAHRAMLDAALAGDADAYRRAVDDHYRPIDAILADELDR
ncbi:FadR family transcriptional regulator [Bifidobacterium callimiconis]|uniref:FadR/GntR family transcriptional regulator n=1 Tax=Bifidobacterium callimiconis TaxID=2306973 RepID=UPI001BDBB68A|nr:FCD domain-containing protein [Bifidobacterium callimiconis]MBT1177575.1 FadR family transcriptional regulator [Bifidobacterium callimiconis]